MANIVLDFLHNYQTGERRETEPANAYQYDEGHVLEAVLPEVITSAEIHYWIRGMEEADAYMPTSITPNEDNSCTVLGNIPNSYFEANGELRIYIVVTDGTASITTYEGKLHICQRSIPDDYVDDDPENEATRILTEAKAAAATATQQAQAASNSAGQAAQSAETLSGSVAQIATNTQDITSLKEDLLVVQTDLSDAQTELEKKANTDGYYEDMTVGDAEQLVSTVTNADDTPYNFRTTAGSADVGDRAYVDAIVGGTVALNQLVDSASIPATKTESGVTFTNNGDGTITVNGTATADIVYVVNPQKTWSDHKYMISGCPKGGSTSTYNLAMRGMGADLFDTGNGNLWNATGNAWKGAVIYIKSGATVTNLVFKPNIFDLTQIFGTTIADYVYGLETATAGAGVAWLKANAPKIFNGGYIPFNAGTLQSVVGLSEKRNTGLNQWDEETEIGDIDGITGAFKTGNYLRTKNHIPVLPNTTYYFDIPSAVYFYEYDANKDVIMNGNYAYHYKSTSGTVTTGANTHYITFRNDISNASQTYHYDICINLHWDGEKDGTYEPYTVHTYAFDPTVELRGVPKLKDGKLYYDGDRYLPDGTRNRRFRLVTFNGTEEWGKESLTWNSNGLNAYYLSINNPDTVAKLDNAVVIPNLCCNKFISASTNTLKQADTTGFIGLIGGNGYGSYIEILHDATDLNSFKTWLASNPITVLYELVTPTTESATPYNHVEIVDEFGTEEFITTSLVPVGHETRYAPNLRAKLEMSPDSPDGDGLYIVQQSSGENTYIPLASSATIQNILARLTALEGNTNEG